MHRVRGGLTGCINSDLCIVVLVWRYRLGNTSICYYYAYLALALRACTFFFSKSIHVRDKNFYVVLLIIFCKSGYYAFIVVCILVILFF